MKDGYDDIRALADRVGERPQWWDENGAPRFAEHHPRHCPDIYSDEVVLLLISCQLCEREIRVQMSLSSMDAVRASMMGVRHISLAERVRGGTIHYGDPPWHTQLDTDEYCHAGCTMNCNDLRVVEFWSRGVMEWVRVAELEVEIPQ